VRVATVANPFSAQVFYATAMGFFKRNGVNVDVSLLATAKAVAESVASGTSDVGSINSLQMAMAFGGGGLYKFVAPGAASDSAFSRLFVARGKTVVRPSDLNNKTVGVSTLNSLDYLSTLAWLDQGGANLSTITFQERPVAAMSSLLNQGRIDAAVIPEPFAEAASGSQLVPVAKVWNAISSHFITTGWFATSSYAAAHRVALARFLLAVKEAGEWAAANPAAADEIVRGYTHFAVVPRMTFASSLDTGAITPLLDAGLKYHLLANPIDANQLIWHP
jgi:NitT/TauT family transport system substrate-binding protein